MFLKKAVKGTVKNVAGTVMDVSGGVREGLLEAVQGVGSNVTTIRSSAAHLAKDAGHGMKTRIANTDNRLLAGIGLGILVAIVLGILLKSDRKAEDDAQ